MDYKPKPGHVWQYQDKSWVEVPIEELDRNIPAFEGPIVGFKRLDGPNGLNETITSHDAVKEYMARTLSVEHDEDSTVWSAIRFYEDVLLWRAFGDPCTGVVSPEVYENLDNEECIRLNQSLKYIKKLDQEELAFTTMIAIQEMEFWTPDSLT